MRQIFTVISVYSNDYKEYHHAKRLNKFRRFVYINGTEFTTNNLRLVRPYSILSAGDIQEDPAYWGNLYDSYLAPSADFPDDAYNVGRAMVPMPGWQVWNCPDAKYMDTVWPDAADAATQFSPDHFWQTYGFNGMDGHTRYAGTAANGATPYARAWFRRNGVVARTGQIDMPSKLIMFQDGAEHMMECDNDSLVELTQYDRDNRAGWFREYFRHNNGCQVMYGDGHMIPVGGPQRVSDEQVYKRPELEPLYSGVYPPGGTTFP
jgi:prepilin-type processing-associated H-X9-DG protein